MSGEPRPWERQIEETAPAYAAFDFYLRAGAARSVTKVAAECNKSRSLINRWSAQHRWVRRAAAWDADLNAEYRRELVEAQRTLAHRHLAVSRQALAKVAAAVAGIDPASLTVAETTRLWEIATRTEREVLPVSTHIEVRGPAGGSIGFSSQMTDEERHARLGALRREIDERISDVDLPPRDADAEEDGITDEG